MVQSPSWEANWFAASQEIPRILWNPKVHYRTHKRPPPHTKKICAPSWLYLQDYTRMLGQQNIKISEIIWPLDVSSHGN